MPRRIDRTRPSGRQLPRLEPRVEDVRISGTDPQADELPKSVSSGLPDSVTSARTESTAGVPRYRQLIRKEARLRADQLEQLSALRRRVQAGRVNRDEPLTDNTLIRVAVDLLLERAAKLTGDTEDQLRKSVLTTD